MRMPARTASRASAPGGIPTGLTRLLLAGALGAACILAAACGSSEKGLIPVANAGPLRADFEAVARSAAHGNGGCGETEEAIQRTEHDFERLPGSVNAGLRNTLRVGIENLRKRALLVCAQPLPQATTQTNTQSTAPTTETTPPPTQTQTTTTPTTPSTTPTVTGPEGGTPAPSPEGGGEEGPGVGKGEGGGRDHKGHSGSGGTGAGE